MGRGQTLRPADRLDRRAADPTDLNDPTDRAAVSRAAILSAAKKLFAAKGYPATSMADIVTEAGTSVGLPYYHFGSKKGVFLTIWDEYQGRQQSRTASAVHQARKSGLTGADLLLAGVRAYLEGAWADRALLPMVHGAGRPPGFDKLMAEGAEQWNRQMLALLAGYEGRLVVVALLMLTEGLSNVCLALSTCRNQVQADGLIDNAVKLTRSLLETVPRSGP